MVQRTTPPIFGPAKRRISILLPSLGETANSASPPKLLSRIGLSDDLHVKVRINSLFNFKSKAPSCLKSSIVYKFTCRGCNASYICQTSRHALVLGPEHLVISAITNKRLSGNSQHYPVYLLLVDSLHPEDLKILNYKFHLKFTGPGNPRSTAYYTRFIEFV